MTTYNTGNPLGSTSVKDLYDNAGNLDHAANDRQSRTWIDRLGKDRKTLWGMEQDFQDFLLRSGYENIGDYGPGLEITAYNQVFRYNNELYRAGPDIDLPDTTTGAWGDEGALFLAAGDGVLRQELADTTDPENGAAMVGFIQHGVGAIARNALEKMRERASIQDFGGVADGTTDDTLAFQSLIQSGRKDICLSGAIRITAPIEILEDAGDLKIICEGPTTIIYDGDPAERVFRFYGVDRFTCLGPLTIDGQGLAATGLDIIANNRANITLENINFLNLTQTLPSGPGANGVLIRCTSPDIGAIASVRDCTVVGVTRTVEGGTCSGITVTDFAVSEISNCHISGISAGGFDTDADGIKIFTQLLDSGAYATGKGTVTGCRIDNCDGRFVKTQVKGIAYVTDNYFTFNGTGNDTIVQWRGVDHQIGNSVTRGNVFNFAGTWTEKPRDACAIYVQSANPPNGTREQRSHEVADNVFLFNESAPSLSRYIFANLDDYGDRVLQDRVKITGNRSISNLENGREQKATIAVDFRINTGRASAGSCQVDILNNELHGTVFMRRLTGGGTDLTGKLILKIINNTCIGGTNVLDFSPGDSYTSSLLVRDNNVGSLGNSVAYPFNFFQLLNGCDFYVGAESSPARTNAPPNYAYGQVSVNGQIVFTDNRSYMYYSTLKTQGSSLTWTRRQWT